MATWLICIEEADRQYSGCSGPMMCSHYKWVQWSMAGSQLVWGARAPIASLHAMQDAVTPRHVRTYYGAQGPHVRSTFNYGCSGLIAGSQGMRL